jgi:hypothetical protein
VPISVRRFAALALAGAALAVASVVGVAGPATASSSQVALTWFDQTQAAVAAAQYPTQISNSRIWAVSWLAAARSAHQAAASPPVRSSLFVLARSP